MAYTLLTLAMISGQLQHTIRQVPDQVNISYFLLAPSQSNCVTAELTSVGLPRHSSART